MEDPFKFIEVSAPPWLTCQQCLCITIPNNKSKCSNMSVSKTFRQQQGNILNAEKVKTSKNNLVSKNWHFAHVFGWIFAENWVTCLWNLRTTVHCTICTNWLELQSIFDIWYWRAIFGSMTCQYLAGNPTPDAFSSPPSAPVPSRSTPYLTILIAVEEAWTEPVL